MPRSRENTPINERVTMEEQRFPDSVNGLCYNKIRSLCDMHFFLFIEVFIFTAIIGFGVSEPLVKRAMRVEIADKKLRHLGDRRTHSTAPNLMDLLLT